MAGKEGAVVHCSVSHWKGKSFITRNFFVATSIEITFKTYLIGGEYHQLTGLGLSGQIMLSVVKTMTGNYAKVYQ